MAEEGKELPGLPVLDPNETSKLPKEVPPLDLLPNENVQIETPVRTGNPVLDKAVEDGEMGADTAALYESQRRIHEQAQRRSPRSRLRDFLTKLGFPGETSGESTTVIVESPKPEAPTELFEPKKED